MQFTKKDTALVKGAAILMMLFHHLFTSAERYAGYEIIFQPFGEVFTVQLARFFKICVGMFVFLSGYGITKSLSALDGNDPKRYMKQIGRRTFSLMSGYWTIFILSVIAAAIIKPSLLSVYRGGYKVDYAVLGLFDFLGLSELFGTPTLNGTWWYMSLALIIIAIMPLLYNLYKKYGFIPLFMLSFIACGFVKNARSDEIVNYDMVRWLFTLDLGIIFADKDRLAKIKGLRIIKKSKTADYIIKLIVFTALLAGSCLLRQYGDWTVSYICDGIVPAYAVIYCYVILGEIPVLRNVLRFFGKHSMNIFLSHTFLRAYYLKDFIYGLKYPALIFAVLTVLSLLLSIIIDLIKKYSGYDKLCGRIIKKIA